ncbi:MAG TPA: hypothetical protein VN783_17490 [Thermoanaerobaculia bacterium]|nr:hypothetical protein [Thermoanaerobaculia bacterium]
MRWPWWLFQEFERLGEPLLPTEQFLRRMARTLLAATGLIGASLGVGILGYRYVQGLSWLDALLNAAMILTGMGPVDRPETAAAKVFASFYALFSGVAFVTSAGIGFAPVAHRLLHRFHLAEEDLDSTGGGGKGKAAKRAAPKAGSAPKSPRR